MARYKYDPTRVRESFRNKYCKTLQLPSGKMSNYDFFPITEDEINSLMADFDSTPPQNSEWTTISEWMLFSALRFKYGVNYLNPQPKSLWRTYERTYEKSEEEKLKLRLEEIAIRMQNYVDHEIEYFNEKYLEKINDGQKSSVKTMDCMEEDYKKYLQHGLDIPDF